MIYLEQDCLEFRFPDLHENAGVSISFQRTLRLPDNDQIHPLPPGLGNFPLRHIEVYAAVRNWATEAADLPLRAD